MKKIEAIVRFSKFEDLKEALEGIGVNFFTYLEVNGHGKQKGETVTYRGAVYDSGDIPRVKIEIVVPEAKAKEVVSAILTNGKTGVIGDGKIIVTRRGCIIKVKKENRKCKI